MTDVLEDLLDEEEEFTEEEAVPRLGYRKVGRPTRSEAETWPEVLEQAVETEKPMEKAGRREVAVPSHPVARSGQEAEGTAFVPLEEPDSGQRSGGSWWAPEGGAAIPISGGQAAGLAQRERGTGEVLYHRLARVRQAAAYRREPGRGWQSLDRPVGGSGGTAPVPAAELDRLVQRDARRYDGGFSWL